MATYIEMPKFGLSMEEGTVTTWFKAEGDAVSQGEAVAEVVTEKITNTVEAPADGVLRKILLQENETALCGAPIGIIASAQEDISALLGETDMANVPDSKPESEAVSKVTAKTAPEVRITPRAEKFAREHGIDYSLVSGTGIGGAITIDDLKKILASPSPAEKPMNEIRKTIAKKMMDSLANTAQTTMSMDVDVSSLVELYNKLKPGYKEEGLKLSYTAFIIKAVGLALAKHPLLRTKLSGSGSLQLEPEINIGVAVDIEEGLVVPVLRNIDTKDLKTICKELENIVQKARQNQLVLDEMTGGVITVSNLGMFGIKYFTPILNLPENSILGVGAVSEQLVAQNGGVFIKQILNLSLTHDHRLVDGAPAARFLGEIKSLLDQPETLIN